MSDFAQNLFMALGAALIVAGILLLVFKPASGENSMKLAGQEVHISAPGLVVILLGCVMFAAPFLIPPRPGPAPEVKQDAAPPTEQAATQPAQTAPAPQPEQSSPPTAMQATEPAKPSPQPEQSSPPAATPLRCKSGYVWRIARPTDFVCVPPESRERTARENAEGPDLIDPAGKYGPESCKPGYVWREAYPHDHVCVASRIRGVVQDENRMAPDRTVQ